MGNRQWAMGNGQWFQPSVEGKFGAEVGKNSRMQESGSVKTKALVGSKNGLKPLSSLPYTLRQQALGSEQDAHTTRIA